MKSPISSLFSLLKHFDLEKYYIQLREKGLRDDNPLTQFLSIDNRRKFTNQLNLMPGHFSRFLRMFSKLEKMAPREGFFDTKLTEAGKTNFFIICLLISLSPSV